MRKTRTLIITAILVVVLGLLTVSMALAGPGVSADSLVSASGGSSNPTGESSVTPADRGLTLLLDQAPNQSNGLFSDADCGACGTGQQSIADNFVLTAPYTIEEIIIWSGYFPGNSQPVDDIDVIFHANAGTLPGAAVSTETNVPATRVQTGVILFGVNEWMTTLTLANPVELTAGTWWVEIFNNTVGNTDNYFWEVGDLDPVNGILNNSFAQQAPGVTWLTGNPVSDNAVQIYGTPVAPPDVPDVAISKSPPTQTIVTNGNADFTITVTNTGDVDLNNVTVTDPLVPACDNNIGALSVGASNSYACTDTGVAASYTNVATVTTDLATGGPGPTASASADVNVVPPTSVSLSGFEGGATTFSPVWLVAILAVVLSIGFVVRRKLTA
jgi:uncharacterized repeat protein (TIGR01451 family)